MLLCDAQAHNTSKVETENKNLILDLLTQIIFLLSVFEKAYTLD